MRNEGNVHVHVLFFPIVLRRTTGIALLNRQSQTNHIVIGGATVHPVTPLTS